LNHFSFHPIWLIFFKHGVKLFYTCSVWCACTNSEKTRQSSCYRFG